MDERPVVVLTGNDLTFKDIVAVGIGDKKVELADSSLEKCRRSREFLKVAVEARKVIYGVNTSFGPMCNKIVNEREIKILQENLIKSHAAGLGAPILPYIALSILTVRLNTLVKGYSGVRIELLELMRDMINSGIAPYIPECGSVGASGDLIHLAHMALAIIGEGKVYLNRKLMDAKKAFMETGLTPLTLSYKEGLALINGTAAMTAIGAFALFGAKKLLNIACVNAAFAIEIFGGIDDAFDMDLHFLKPHPGQIAVTEAIRSLYRGTGNLTFRDDIHDKIREQSNEEIAVFETNINVQDVYSLRCTPQVLAPVMETIDQCIATLEIEANSTNDNPIIVPEKGKILHGGNFHGQSIAFAMDALSIALSTLCNLSERRLNKILDKKLNEGLPEFLIVNEPGLSMGFMGAQYLATSTTAENRNQTAPMSVNSISCNASNQDIVSMGTVAARKAFGIVSKAKHVITLETFADFQALSFRNSDKLGFGTRKIYNILQDKIQVYDESRIFHDDLSKLRKLLFSSQLFDDLSVYGKSS
ncbi:Histidine ammonia-lyase 2 [Desulfamplus magnetovallimortis]|uniref:Histidine ammonia-lyase 2 n=1 Tax=Desulfamplus magnetovallimortis TaxID=1246637 RepID=L0R5F2_9BACT|nr:aromatic amino acid ammonia-lyase [Desulfamplus magnetovallimortis]CCO06750.1 Histidine ammonia-lyase 2 [Desulfamplus magnetovallimortis BW-1]SLM32801.1 Histidine ammonia-lyase 2 [Desulfamplus magnetovallimortis]